MRLVHVARIDPEVVPVAQGGYAQGLVLTAAERLLFISGQIPEDRAGRAPDGFEAQCRQVWRNVLAVLADAGMEPRQLVKVTTFLTRREDADVNGAVRREALGDHRPALTVMVVQTLAEPWLLEIEAIAAC